MSISGAQQQPGPGLGQPRGHHPPSHPWPRLLAASPARKGGQVHPWSIACDKESLKASSVSQSALVMIRLIAASLLPTNLTLQVPCRKRLMDTEKHKEMQTQQGYCWVGGRESAVGLFAKPGGINALKIAFAHNHCTHTTVLRVKQHPKKCLGKKNCSSSFSPDCKYIGKDMFRNNKFLHCTPPAQPCSASAEGD